jgi:hypothetical protein
MLCAALFIGGCTTAPIAYPSAPKDTSAQVLAEQKAAFERDRQSILAMAGLHKVSFDLRETVSLSADYTPAQPKPSGGTELVKVIEDTGTVIRLQHILVGKTRSGKEFTLKHWRQDWIYEPTEIVVYHGNSTWTKEPVSAEARKGAWAQIVWQSDDSPRYSGLAKWRYDGGETRWAAYDAVRPLARRDAVKKPPFDRYLAMNRHTLIPNGWVHEQDNAKQGPLDNQARDGELKVFVHEVGVNTYTRNPDAALTEQGDKYWTATAEYWAAVRKTWDAQFAKTGTLHVPEVAESGSDTTIKLLTLSDEIVEGKQTTAAAIAAATAEILSKTTTTK